MSCVSGPVSAFICTLAGGIGLAASIALVYVSLFGLTYLAVKLGL